MENVCAREYMRWQTIDNAYDVKYDIKMRSRWHYFNGTIWYIEWLEKSEVVWDDWQERIVPHIDFIHRIRKKKSLSKNTETYNGKYASIR